MNTKETQCYRCEAFIELKQDILWTDAGDLLCNECSDELGRDFNEEEELDNLMNDYKGGGL